MPKPYDQFEGDDFDEPKIIGQVSGPRSFSEYEGADFPHQGYRRNGTPLPDAPRARGR